MSSAPLPARRIQPTWEELRDTLFASPTRSRVVNWFIWLPPCLAITGMFLWASYNNVAGEDPTLGDAFLAGIMGGILPLLSIARAYASGTVAPQYPKVEPGNHLDFVGMATSRIDAANRLTPLWTTGFLVAHATILPFVWWLAPQVGEGQADGGLAQFFLACSLILLGLIALGGAYSQLVAHRSAAAAHEFITTTLRETPAGDFFARVTTIRARGAPGVFLPLFQGYIALNWLLLGAFGLVAAVKSMHSFLGS